MKKILLTTILLLSACTSNHSPVTNTDTELDFVAADASIDISNLMLDPSLNLAPDVIPTFETTSSSTISKVVTLTNGSASAYSLSSIKISDPANGFKIALNRCSSTLAAKGKCQITVSFSSRSLYDGQQNSSLEINEHSVQLSALVSNQPNPDTTGTSNLQVTLDAPFVPATFSSTRILTIKNIGDGTAQNVAAAIPSSYTVLINRCPSSLKPGVSCTIRINDKNFRAGIPAADQAVTVDSSGPQIVVSLPTGLPPVVIPVGPVMRDFEWIVEPSIYLGGTVSGNITFDEFDQGATDPGQRNYVTQSYFNEIGFSETYSSVVFPNGNIVVSIVMNESNFYSMTEAKVACSSPSGTLNEEFSIPLSMGNGGGRVEAGTNGKLIGYAIYLNEMMGMNMVNGQVQIFSMQNFTTDSKMTCRLTIN